MKRSVAFVDWEEVFSKNHKGRREVRYYLKRWDGNSDLAVIGKEKKLGHNTKTASYRYRYAIRDKSLLVLLNLSFGLCSKLRSRREVIDWLNSVVSDGSSPRPPQSVDGFMEAGDSLGPNLDKLEDVQSHEMSQYTKEFLWVGSAWTCRKKRKHYKAYSRNGIKILVHDFVYVLEEEGKRLIAYLDDMYEDSRGNKMVVVRWFHKVDEVGLDSPHSYNDREIFFSLCLQDLSIECIDGLATVLSPQHYETSLKAGTHTKLEPFVCQNLFDNEDLKPFDIPQVKGYWKQKIHKFMSTTLKHCSKLQTFDDNTKFETRYSDAVEVRPRKRLRRLKDTDTHLTSLSKRDAEYSSDLPFPHDGGSNSQNENSAEGYVNEYAFVRKHHHTIGSQIEVLSQDSGIRGCWFRAVIIKKLKDRLKVRYQDIKDVDDESINLEEWISSSRIAAPDRLGIRLCGRMTIRPARLPDNFNLSLIDVGSVVDAWLHDGWWEGIVVHKESEDRIHVYFPGEQKKSILGCRDLRYSEEWLGDRWIQMKGRPDLLGSMSSATEITLKTTKRHDITSSLAGVIHDKERELISGHKDNSLENHVVGRDSEVVHHPSKKGLLTHLNWNWSTKKRHGRNSFQRLQRVRDASNNSLEFPETSEHNNLFMPSSVKVNHDNWKFIHSSSLFCPSVAPPLTSLVMSR